MISAITLLGYFSFYLELLIALLIIMLHSERRSYFALKVIILFVLGIGFYFLPTISIGAFSLSYFIVFIVVYIIGLILFKEKPLNLFVFACAAFALQHIAWHTLFLLVENVWPNGDLDPIYMDLLFYIVFMVVYGIMGIIRFVKPNLFDCKVTGVLSIIVCLFVLLVTGVLSALLPQYVEWNWIIRLYTILSCVLALLIFSGVFEQSKLNTKKVDYELENRELKRLIALQAKEYENMSSTIDMINIKVHDIKKQMNVINQLPLEQQNEMYNDLKDTISIYENIAKTGNPILDAILSEKSFLCSGKDIKLSYICDGEALNFMKGNHIIALIGNILDNAIEATSKIEDKNLRIIKLNISIKKDFLCIHQENFTTNEVKFFNGLPLTTKGNDIVHGYGTKSIRYIVNKYDGNVTFNIIDNIFSTNITIPIP